MLMGTKSLSGAVIAVVFLLLVVGRQVFRKVTRANLFKAAAIACLAIVLVFAVFTVGGIREFITSQVDTFWKYKEESARIHFDDLRFPPGFFELGIFEGVLGKAGLHSENFYWSVLLNEGAIGLVLMIFAIWTALREAGKSASRWSTLVLFWAISVLVASIGIPYLKVFPTNMLF